LFLGCQTYVQARSGYIILKTAQLF